MSFLAGRVSGVVARAKEKALKRRQRLSTAHLLIVFYQQGGTPSTLLKQQGVREVALLSALKVVDQEPVGAFDVSLEKARKLAEKLGQEVVELHLLAVLSRDARSAAHRCLIHAGVKPSELRDQVMEALGVADPNRPRAKARRPSKPHRNSAATITRRPMPPIRPSRGGGEPQRRATCHRQSGSQAPRRSPLVRGASGPARPKPPEVIVGADAQAPVTEPGLNWYDLDAEAFPLLSEIGRNLTAAAAAGDIDPLVGREAELEQLLDVLARRRSNNPLLVGPPGVGKTALVEGLALRLSKGMGGVEGLRDRILIEVSPGSLVSGTGVRGALAQRVKKLRDEVARSEGRLILFVDEIHAVVGGGEGPDDLANELKASLARGELPCIGATTDAEYRKYFEKDAALARRFSVVHVEEPSSEDTLAILQGLGPRYEEHHGVSFTAEAYDAAVGLSTRFMPESRLPDKAIGVVDMAAARVSRRGGKVVGADEVASVVADQARVPLERLTMGDADQLLKFESLMAERVVGHEEAIGRIADTLRKGAAGFRGRRPLGTFLLLGPTGVGKTETARAVSELMFPSGGMTRIDMSEYSESHAVARMMGAPPGYVGHEEGGQLTDAVRRRPYQLLLLDEVDKAHPEVLLTLLPLLDEGRLTDGRGRTVDFTNTIVFMTSNYGVAAAGNSERRIGFSGESGESSSDPEGARWLDAARKALPPELWNRIDEPLFFRPLRRDDVAAIARRMLESLGAKLYEERCLELRVEDSAIDALIDSGGFDAALGARPMRRVIGRLVESPLAARMLRGDFDAGDVVEVLGKGGDVVLRRGRDEAAAE